MTVRVAAAFLLLIMSGATARSAPAPATIRIGLFNLFHPKTLILSPVGTAITLTGDGINRTLEPGTRYRLADNGTELVLTHSTNPKPVFRGPAFSLSAPTGVEVMVTSSRTRLARRLQGTIVFSVGREGIRTVLTESFEDAVAAIVAAEFSGVKLPEALKAGAVTVRSFLLTHLGRHRTDGYDVCDNTHCQLYFGELSNRRLGAEEAEEFGVFPAARQAAAATVGETLDLGGRTVEGYFTAACGGHTTTPESAWNDTGPEGGQVCDWCRDARFYRWQRQAARGKVFAALASVWGGPPGERVSLKIGARTRWGFVRTLELTDGARSVTVANATFRRLIGRSLGWNTVLSSAYTIEDRGERFVFRGKGFGHHVGLCVAGAVAQAKAGRGYRAILEFYFPKAVLVGTGDGDAAISSRRRTGWSRRVLDRVLEHLDAARGQRAR